LTGHFGSGILDLTVFLKSQELRKIYSKSSQNSSEIYKFVNAYNLMKKSGKYIIVQVPQNLPRENRETHAKEDQRT